MQNILSYRTLTTYSINNQDTTIEFKRPFTSSHTIHTAPLMSPQDCTTHPNTTQCMGSNHLHHWQPTHYDTITPWPDIRGKTTLAKTKYRVTLPNRDELENVTDLFLRYIDILGTEKGEKIPLLSPFEYQPTANHVTKAVPDCPSSGSWCQRRDRLHGCRRDHWNLPRPKEFQRPGFRSAQKKKKKKKMVPFESLQTLKEPSTRYWSISIRTLHQGSICYFTNRGRQ